MKMGGRFALRHLGVQKATGLRGAWKGKASDQNLSTLTILGMVDPP